MPYQPFSSIAPVSGAGTRQALARPGSHPGQPAPASHAPLAFVAAAFVLVVALLAASLAAPQPAHAAGDPAFSDTPTVSVVNFQPVWGDVEANVSQMETDIQQAADEGADLVLLPEMCVTGYVAADDLSSPEAQLAVGSAEAVDGPVATRISQLAQRLGIWVVYGNTEKIPGDDAHAYNSAFACAPDGTVSTYQKIHPVEGAWCTPGQTPMILETPWGKIGVDICYDTYAVPELERYYASQGCRMLLNPTATSRGFDVAAGDSSAWQGYFSARVDNIAIRDGIYVASANLAGYDGSHYTFPGGSCVVGPTVGGGETSFKQYYVSSPAEQAPGVYTGTLDLSTATATDILASDNFKPALYSAWYADLADDTASDLHPAPATSSAVVSTVNFQPTFGDKDANLASMEGSIEQAAEGGTNILVFPEMALTGYAWTDAEGAANGQAAVDLAETVDGPYATRIAELAREHNMYIVFGTSEKIDGDQTHAYNSAFVASPDGSVQSYRKIAPVEGPWCTAGSEPLIVDTPWGAMGISICKDTYAYPELARYYMAKGCTYLVNPTARTGVAAGWEELYENALENLADQDKMIVVSADLCGADLAAPAEQAGWDAYSGASGICAPLAGAQDGSYVRTWGSFASDPSAVGMITATIDYADLWLGGGNAISGFSPALYAQLYAGATFENPSAVIPPAPAGGEGNGSDGAVPDTTPDVSTEPDATDQPAQPTEVADTESNATPAPVALAQTGDAAAPLAAAAALAASVAVAAAMRARRAERKAA